MGNAKKKKKVFRYAVALLYRDDSLLFLRKKGSKDPLSLPCCIKKGVGHKRNLKKYFLTEFGAKIAFLRNAPETVVYLEEESRLARPFSIQCDVMEHPDGYEFVFLDEKDLATAEIEPMSQLLAKRAFIYAPWYQNRPRTIPLLERDQEKVYWEIECLKHFHRRIPSAEIAEFEGLVSSASSLRRINAAFTMLCNHYRCDPNQFIRYLDYREKKRKALR